MGEVRDTAGPDATPPAMDLGRLLENLGDDRVVARELMRLFIEDVGQRLPELERAFLEGDQETLQRHAHTLKGAGSNLCASRFSQRAFDLQQAAEAGDGSGPTREMINALREEAVRVRSYMTDLLSREET